MAKPTEAEVQKYKQDVNNAAQRKIIAKCLYSYLYEGKSMKEVAELHLSREDAGIASQVVSQYTRCNGLFDWDEDRDNRVNSQSRYRICKKNSRKTCGMEPLVIKINDKEIIIEDLEITVKDFEDYLNIYRAKHLNVNTVENGKRQAETMDDFMKERGLDNYLRRHKKKEQVVDVEVEQYSDNVSNHKSGLGDASIDMISRLFAANQKRFMIIIFLILFVMFLFRRQIFDFLIAVILFVLCVWLIFIFIKKLLGFEMNPRKKKSGTKRKKEPVYEFNFTISGAIWCVIFCYMGFMSLVSGELDFGFIVISLLFIALGLAGLFRRRDIPTRSNKVKRTGSYTLNLTLKSIIGTAILWWLMLSISQYEAPLLCWGIIAVGTYGLMFRKE